MKNNVITFSLLKESDLMVDSIYEGGSRGNAGDDPISKLLMTGNQGGFRYVGTLQNIRLCALYSELSDPEWPDILDTEFGRFSYYGDNKNAGYDLHDTRRKGNLVLKNTFNALHLNMREKIPPFFVFTKGGKGRDVVFRGLAVPGATSLSNTEDLIAIWKSKKDERFQNYKAVFTILDISSISRKWLNDIHNNNPVSENSPKKWLAWIKGGAYHPLIAPRSLIHRTIKEQLPSNSLQLEIIIAIITFFKQHKDREYAFEKCAVEIIKYMDTNVVSCDLTRFWRDGGRDAIGEYKIGVKQSEIKIDFAVEAKCKNLKYGSGIKETSRLVARLRHRQFGVFVTTSYVSEQAYKELVEDMHPVVILSGKDIANILIQQGYVTVEAVKKWLNSNFS